MNFVGLFHHDIGNFVILIGKLVLKSGFVGSMSAKLKFHFNN